MPTRSNTFGWKERRKLSAKGREAERAERTDLEQLDKLIEEGHGQCKEAKRLAMATQP